jgi:hypothetical protein
MADNKTQKDKQDTGRHKTDREVCDHRMETEIGNQILQQARFLDLGRYELRAIGTANRTNIRWFRSLMDITANSASPTTWHVSSLPFKLNQVSS